MTLIGCGCSTATIPVAEISHYWNIPQVKRSNYKYIKQQVTLNKYAFLSWFWNIDPNKGILILIKYVDWHQYNFTFIVSKRNSVMSILGRFIDLLEHTLTEWSVGNYKLMMSEKVYCFSVVFKLTGKEYRTQQDCPSIRPSPSGTVQVLGKKIIA